MPPVSPPGCVESEACDGMRGFRAWTSGENRWHLAGEADLSADSVLRLAMLTASVSRHELVLDCGELSFIDVSGLRVIASAALALGSPVVVNGANEMLRRAWSLLDLHAAAPNVEFST
ncbi:MAG TPA: STAS domain-containing protein [Actinocrinis sp.]|nr:STAS domain-containing protein [Actinocrinis sp.]